jgi:hypothetical protein
VGRPTLALVDSLLSALVLCVMFVCALQFLGDSRGILVMGWAWFAASVLLLFMLVRFAQMVIPFSLRQLLESVLPGVGGLLLLSALAFAAELGLSGLLPWQRLIVRLALLLCAYFLYLRFALGIRREDLVGTRNAKL